MIVTMKQKASSYQLKLFLIASALLTFVDLYAQKEKGSFYQISVYHYKDTAQENTIDEYLQNALLPALHRMKISNIGVFKELSNDTASDKKTYVLMPVQSLSDVAGIASKLTGDASYHSAGNRYLNATYDAAPYNRMETILLQAFPWRHKWENRN